VNVVVVGAGALGSLLGGLLAREHDVTLVGRDPHVARVREAGLSVVGAVSASVAPRATVDATGLSADLALVTVKAHDTGAAADALATGDYGAVCPLGNGLTEGELAGRLDVPVLSGVVTYGARLRDPGVVECTGVGRVVLGAREGGTDPRAERAGRAFRDAGVRTLVATDMPLRRWEKLAVNAGINATTALARVDNGAVVDADAPAGRVAREAARETAAVARAEGVSLTDERAADALATVAGDTAANRSSMLEDVEAGRRTEVDAINGAVVDRAATRGIAVPTNAALAGLLRAWERGRDLG
jgi:2-dehydropantoate 2-reductase